MDAETARGVLAEVRRLAEGPVAESFADADRNPPVFDPATNSVTLPESFKKSVQAIKDGEWYRLDLPEHLGGFGAPPSLTLGRLRDDPRRQPGRLHVRLRGRASPPSSTSWARRSRSSWPQLMLDTRWGATMVLTEPDAGSDVGAGRTKAVQQPDGSWHIDGVKRFITSAEHDLSDNIIHLVLARPEGAKAGTKGLSLFVVPKFHFDPQTGELGERNGAYVTNVEKKMGLKVSTTCELTFGADRRARAGLAGRRGARRHRADVQGHRARPDVRRRQGDRHAVGRLPGRARLREEPRPGRRPDGDDEGRPPGAHHPPPGRAPLADAAEVLRRGHAGAVPLHRELPRPGHRGRGRRAPPTASRRSSPSGSTTCCCRS